MEDTWMQKMATLSRCAAYEAAGLQACCVCDAPDCVAEGARAMQEDRPLVRAGAHRDT